MLRILVCGSRFHSEEDEQLRCVTRTSSGNSFSKWSRKNVKNPYSNRGLDKFSKLMADLEERRQKIYLQRGSEDIALIRFVNSSSGGFVPIVVKLKGVKHKAEGRTGAVTKEKKVSTQHSKISHESSDTIKEVKERESKRYRKNEKKSFSWDDGNKKNKWMQTSWDLPMVIIIVLLFLALFGRSFAILCTFICWFLVPALTGEKPSLSRRSEKTTISSN